MCAHLDNQGVPGQDSTRIAARVHESAGGGAKGFIRLPREPTHAVPAFLLPQRRRAAGDTRADAQHTRGAAAPEEVLREHEGAAIRGRPHHHAHVLGRGRGGRTRAACSTGR